MKKRGISPFIASVILIIVVVSVGVIVANFTRGYIGRQLDTAESQETSQMKCSTDVNIAIYELNEEKQIYDDGENISVMLQNKGQADITSFSIDIIGTNDTASGTMDGGNLTIGEIKNFLYTYSSNVGTVRSVKIKPVILQGGKLIECIAVGAVFSRDDRNY